MVQDDLKKHLDNSIYGTPLIKPEEQRKYLGTFRERCYTTLTIAQMKKATSQRNLLKEIAKYPEGIVLLNGSISNELQASYIKILSDTKTKFTIVNDHVNNTPDSFGLILATKKAVNEKIIDIEEKYPLQADLAKKPVKKSFWRKIFG